MPSLPSIYMIIFLGVGDRQLNFVKHIWQLHGVVFTRIANTAILETFSRIITLALMELNIAPPRCMLLHNAGMDCWAVFVRYRNNNKRKKRIYVIYSTAMVYTYPCCMS